MYRFLIPFLTAGLVASTAQPNIVIILGDGIGYGDFGC